MALLIIPVLKSDQELEVHRATYGPGIDQSQHRKSVSHIIKKLLLIIRFEMMLGFIGLGSTPPHKA